MVTAAYLNFYHAHPMMVLWVNVQTLLGMAWNVTIDILAPLDHKKM